MLTVDEKLAALAARCHAPRFGPDGVCDVCCFARRITTQISATPLSAGSAGMADAPLQATMAVCTYRQRLVIPLLDLHEVSNPGLSHADERSAEHSEGEQVRQAFADAPAEERQAFETLIDSLHAQLERARA